ncbi:MAG: hypothetical protein ACJ74V_03205 [Gaiellaceae bacterium]
MRRVEVVIDELVLRGVDPAQARAAAAVLETRLAALAGAHDAGVRERAEAYRRLAPVTAAPDELGGAVADAVWKAIA